MFNRRLIEQNNVSDDDVLTLTILHQEKDSLFELLEEIDDKTDAEIYEIVLEIEDLEFLMQQVWKFKQDKKYHTHWAYTPNCTCKKPRFNPECEYSPSCKIHRTRLIYDT